MKSFKPLVFTALSIAGILGGCHHESKIPPRAPIAVRLATVTTAETSGETLRYSASILPYAQVDLTFRSSGYITDVRQVRARAQLDQAVARHTKADQDFQRAQALYSTQSLTRNDAAPLEGRVTSISPAADTRARIFSVEVTVNNRDPHLRPGMIASVSLGEAPHS